MPQKQKPANKPAQTPRFTFLITPGIPDESYDDNEFLMTIKGKSYTNALADALECYLDARDVDEEDLANVWLYQLKDMSFKYTGRYRFETVRKPVLVEKPKK